jgi:hypothetical protein
MPFAKLSDDYGDDCWTLSDAAFRLHTEALVWSGRKLLDCVIPKGDLRRFAKHPEAAEELVAVGWWSQTPETYIIRHQARYQRSKAEALAIQQRNVENGQKGGRPPKPSREQWNPDNPDGFPDGNPNGNPPGKDRKGKAPGRGESSKREEQRDLDPWEQAS